MTREIAVIIGSLGCIALGDYLGFKIIIGRLRTYVGKY